MPVLVWPQDVSSLYVGEGSQAHWVTAIMHKTFGGSFESAVQAWCYQEAGGIGLAWGE